jgi:hypothetical protein
MKTGVQRRDARGGDIEGRGYASDNKSGSETAGHLSTDLANQAISPAARDGALKITSYLHM